MLKLVTFNIRYDCQQDGENNFSNRKPLIVEKLSLEKPDIICFQEILPHVAVWLKETFTDYYMVGCGRGEILDGEQVTVAYRPDRLNLISMETFWLSETPYVPASRYPDQSICPRVCTEVLLEDMTEKKVLRIFNFHLDHEGAQSRKRGLSQILKKAAEARLFPDAPIILTGDFNAAPDSEEMGVLKERPEYRNLTDGIGITYHGFSPENTPECIDYVYASGALSCTGVKKWEDRKEGVWLSDHYPVCVQLEYFR